MYGSRALLIRSINRKYDAGGTLTVYFQVINGKRTECKLLWAAADAPRNRFDNGLPVMMVRWNEETGIAMQRTNTFGKFNLRHLGHRAPDRTFLKEFLNHVPRDAVRGPVRDSDHIAIMQVNWNFFWPRPSKHTHIQTEGQITMLCKRRDKSKQGVVIQSSRQDSSKITATSPGKIKDNCNAPTISVWPHGTRDTNEGAVTLESLRPKRHNVIKDPAGHTNLGITDGCSRHIGDRVQAQYEWPLSPRDNAV